MQHVLMVVVWPANFFLVRQPIVQTELTGVADLNDLTTMVGQYTIRINDIQFLKISL